MQKLNLPPDLFAATRDASNPLRRYAALQVCWSINPLDIACRDLLVPGGKNSLPTPQGADWDTVLEHRKAFENSIKENS